YILIYYKATTEIYTLSLHDALPISEERKKILEDEAKERKDGQEKEIEDFKKKEEKKTQIAKDEAAKRPGGGGKVETSTFGGSTRSEEHTSELQSRENLVCRLLLEKK